MNTKVAPDAPKSFGANGLDLTPKFAIILSAVYVHLWVVEGALRKWVPGSEQIMYVARDGFLLVGILWAGLFLKSKKRNGPIFWSFYLLMGFLATIQIMIGMVSLPVGAIGLRGYIAPTLLAYLVWVYACPDLIPTISRIIAFHAPLQLVVAVVQVMSSKSSWINKEVGSDAAYFANGLVVRASGTFSAPAGLSLYVPLCLAVSLWLIHRRGGRDRFVAISGISSAAVVTVVSGARGTVLAVSFVLVTYFLLQLAKLKGSGLRNAFVSTGAVVGLTWISIQAFPTVFEAFLLRFANAATSENSADRLVSQVIGYLVEPITWAGNGVGNHSTAGMAAGGDGPWVEVEALKWVVELGLFGWLMASARLVLCAYALFIAISKIRNNNGLSVLLCSFMIPVLMYGQITQFPSAQAAFSVCLGLFLLSTMTNRGPSDDSLRPFESHLDFSKVSPLKPLRREE